MTSNLLDSLKQDNTPLLTADELRMWSGVWSVFDNCTITEFLANKINQKAQARQQEIITQVEGIAQTIESKKDEFWRRSDEALLQSEGFAVACMLFQYVMAYDDALDLLGYKEEEQ
jgi:hypothetical protein